LNKKRDYINANWVPMMTCSTTAVSHADSAASEYFINTQAPTSHTSKHFWAMVWEQRIALVVMLTQECEDGRKRADRYWPLSGEERYGAYSVTLTHQCAALNRSTVIRVLHLRSPLATETRVVYHVQYLAWPDRAVPSDSVSFLRLLDMTRLLHAKLRGPLAVMCSAGIGRTGTFTTLYAHMLHLLAQRHCCRPATLVHHLRLYRPGSVQTAAQYQFICHTAHWLQQIYGPVASDEHVTEHVTLVR
jgi:protein-tyrosine phosphatase